MVLNSETIPVLKSTASIIPELESISIRSIVPPNFKEPNSLWEIVKFDQDPLLIFGYPKACSALINLKLGSTIHIIL